MSSAIRGSNAIRPSRWLPLVIGAGFALTAAAVGELEFQPTDIRLDTDPAGTADSRDIQIASDSTDHVYVVWSDRRDSEPDWTRNIHLNVSDDNGATWRADDIRLSVNEPNYYHGDPQICTDDNGNV